MWRYPWFTVNSESREGPWGSEFVPFLTHSLLSLVVSHLCVEQVRHWLNSQPSSPVWLSCLPMGGCVSVLIDARYKRGDSPFQKENFVYYGCVCVCVGGISVCLLIWESYKYEETFGPSFYRRERAGLAQGHSAGEK